MYEKSQFNSLVWGSLTLTPIIICTTSAVKTIIEAFQKHSRNLPVSLSKQLHFAVFYKCVLLILLLPTLNFSHF